MPFYIVRQDITKMKVNAIVNAANTSLLQGGGVCGAIFRAAGEKQLARECSRLAPIETGEAVVTKSFALMAKYIIHAAGPIYRNYTPETAEKLLYSAYKNSLQLAVKHGCKSIAFPLISSGIYGYPKREALEVATAAIRDFLAEHELEVYLAIYDKSSFVPRQSLLAKVDEFLAEHYVAEAAAIQDRSEAKQFADKQHTAGTGGGPMPFMITDGIAHCLDIDHEMNLDQLLEHMAEPFAAALMKLIDEKGMTAAEVYKGANIDRRVFSKIRTVEGYTPTKKTILSIAISMHLSLEETEDLLKRAGYAFSNAKMFDVIVEYFITNRQYDMYDINEILFAHDQPQLGA